MAVVKKVSTDKAKATVKKVAIKQVKAKKKPPYIIKVKRGSQELRTFHLTPSLPIDGQAANWLLAEPHKPRKDIDSIHFSFNPHSSTFERDFERVIVQIKIQQNPKDKGIWRFASDGVAVNPAFSHVNHDVTVEIVDQGFTLIAQVQSISTTPEEIRFGYLASFTDNVSGAVLVYESQDPDVHVGRP